LGIFWFSRVIDYDQLQIFFWVSYSVCRVKHVKSHLRYSDFYRFSLNYSVIWYLRTTTERKQCYTLWILPKFSSSGLSRLRVNSLIPTLSPYRPTRLEYYFINAACLRTYFGACCRYISLLREISLGQLLSTDRLTN
jgi:hypothetical protein